MTELKFIAFCSRLIALKGTVLLSSQGGRKLYNVKLTPAHKVLFGGFGGHHLSRKFAIKTLAEVTGNPYDIGFVLIDARDQLASRCV
jgi:hypothetical protein